MLDLLPVFGHLNPRLAAFLMLALLLGAAFPLALAWTKILPPERDPFSRPDLPRSRGSFDRPSFFFLANVSLSLLAAIPRIADTLHLDALAQLLPANWSEHIAVLVLIWLVFVPALAAAYSAVRPNPIRKHLIFGGILVLILWLLSPTLLSSLSS
ncbi:MAG: hypothetical protein JSS69_15715 [Acidobacteria bacterium]|nr:hypothetical protein [Acidobacteriota bacterium]MBS1867361.1 hypothetical protein [Acidobacteriota bacterium]